MRTKIQALVMAMIALTFVLWTGNASFAYEEEVTPGADPSSAFKPSIKLGGRIQTIWETSLHKTDGDQLDAGGSQFYLGAVRMKANFKLHPRFKGRVHLAREPNSSQGRGAEIKEAFIIFKVHNAFNIELGRFIYGFHRERFSGGVKLFVNFSGQSSRSGVNNRDDGVQFFGKLWDKKIYYMVSVTAGKRNIILSRTSNNTGGTASANVPNNYQITGRIQIDPLGEWKHGKEWLTGGDAKLKLSSGLGWVWRGKNKYSTTAQEDEFGLTGDLLVSWNRLYMQAFVTWLSSKSNSGTAPQQDNRDFFGWNVDVGVKIIPKMILFTARFDTFNGDDVQGSGRYPNLRFWSNNSKTTQVTLGFFISPFKMGHKVKLQPQVIFDLKREYLGVSQKKRMYLQLGAQTDF